MASRKHLIECPHCRKQFNFTPPSKKKATPEETIVFKLCKKIWLEEIHKGWTFGGAQAGGLKQILGKIKETIEKSERFVYSQELHVNCFRAFALKAQGNTFYKDKDLQILNSKYNEILALPKTPQANGYHNQTSGERFSKLQ